MAAQFFRLTAMAMETRPDMLVEILARLPLRSISRFKSVCKTWKSTLESAYFRRLFLSVHRNSSSSWSLLLVEKELIGFHGCKTWDLPKSPASLIPPSFKRDYAASSSGLVLITDGSDKSYCYVGNPILQEWIKIPPPPDDSTGDSTVFGLVTRVEEDGVVSSFKVIRLASIQATNNYISSILSVFVYSSETGIWISKNIHCAHQITNMFYIDMNGSIFFSRVSIPGVLVAHDFYSESDQFRVVQLPDHSGENMDFRRTLTTSRGFVMYVRALTHKEEETVLKIWRLNNDDDSWQLLWDIGLAMIGKLAPMAMHPFDVGVVYLWNQHDHHLVSCNLRTHKCTIIRDAYNDGHQDCFVDQALCDKSVDEIWFPMSSSDDVDLGFTVSIWLLPFVLPRWTEPVPRPPQAEMIDTTTLLSYTASTQATMMRDRYNDDDEYFFSEA